MDSETVISRPLVAWGVATRPFPGETSSGDLYLVKPVDHGILLAVVDGLGHGDQAALAARIAVAVLERYADDPIPYLVRRCHDALTKTRGVVMTLGFVDARADTLTWLGVGNVEALLLRAKASGRQGYARAVLRNGLVGYGLPDLRTSVVPIERGDLLVFVTDGFGAGFANGWHPDAPPQQVADRIMELHFKGTDDALVLVARYLGGGDE